MTNSVLVNAPASPAYASAILADPFLLPLTVRTAISTEPAAIPMMVHTSILSVSGKSRIINALTEINKIRDANAFTTILPACPSLLSAFRIRR